MKSYIIVSNKPWNKSLPDLLEKNGVNWIFIEHKENLKIEYIEQINPDYVFFSHWSYKIPVEIYSRYKCIVFHMTDLPYGRGGSPLQNLIVRGFKETKISAIKVVDEIDAGPIYLKQKLKLDGSARTIFERSNNIIALMIKKIINDNPKPKEQQGEIVHFYRRKPEDGNLNNAKDINEVYDYIRMLDCEGYPNAFISINGMKIEFTKAKLNNESLTAHVKFIKQ